MITNDYLDRKFTLILWIGIPLIGLIIYMLFFYEPSYHIINSGAASKPKEQFLTENTVRIYGEDFYETAAAISQIVYPASFNEDKPNAVILVRGDKKLDAIAAAAIIHHPVNAPILYVEEDSIPEATLKEIERLDPQGVFVDRNIKAILIGDIGEGVINKVKDMKLGYRQIKGDDPFKLGKKVSDYLAAINGDYSDIVMVASADMPEYALPQGSWNAHMGNGFFYVDSDKVPKETLEGLNERFGEAYIYLLGDKEVISPKVELELSKYGHIQRVPGGKDIYSKSVGFAGYRDIGKNFSWWIGKRERDFGWGISEPGHNFIFVNPFDWQSAVAASLLSHKGKHGPMLLVERDTVSNSVENYLNIVKPTNTVPQERFVNHGWIIGSLDSISYKNQIEIERLLSSGGE